ncbi:MAG: BrnT family toxin [Nitrospira sp.]|nr:BrnT family toxin [Nitrospira sp.]
MARPFQYHFEWDPAKATQNLRKHGIPFEQAAMIFKDAAALSHFDEGHSEYEERWITMGMDATEVLLVACHTFQETADDSATIRLISARKATKTEMKQYRKG